MRPVIKKTICSALMLVQQTSSSAATYRVQVGDTLSDIASRFIPTRIYGKKGGLQRLLILNKHISASAYILPGQILELGDCITAEQPLSKEITSVPEEAKADIVKVAEKQSVTPNATQISASPVMELAPRSEAQNIDFKRFSELALIPKLYYSRIDGTDLENQTKAELLSDANFGAELIWSQYFSRQFKTHIGLNLNHETYLGADPKNTAIKSTFNGRTQNLSGFEVGVAYYWLSSSFRTLADIGVAQEVFYQGTLTSEGGVSMQSVPVSYVAAGICMTIVEAEPFSIEIETIASALNKSSTSNYSVDAGSKYLGSMSLIQKFEQNTIFAKGYFSELRQRTSIIDLTRSDIGLELGVVTELGSKPVETSKGKMTMAH